MFPAHQQPPRLPCIRTDIFSELWEHMGAAPPPAPLPPPRGGGLARALGPLSQCSTHCPVPPGALVQLPMPPGATPVWESSQVKNNPT